MQLGAGGERVYLCNMSSTTSATCAVHATSLICTALMLGADIHDMHDIQLYAVTRPMLVTSSCQWGCNVHLYAKLLCGMPTLLAACIHCLS